MIFDSPTRIKIKSATLHSMTILDSPSKDLTRSKQVYATVLSNRIAHPIAESQYREVYSDDEYFYTDCFKLSDKEVYVDTY